VLNPTIDLFHYFLYDAWFEESLISKTQILLNNLLKYIKADLFRDWSFDDCIQKIIHFWAFVDNIVDEIAEKMIIFDRMLWVPTPVHVIVIHRYVHHVLNVIFGQGFIHFCVVLKISLHFYLILGWSIELLLSFVTESLEIHLTF